MSRPYHRIVGTALRVTADFRCDALRKAGERLEQRVIERRAWLAEQRNKPKPGTVLKFGKAVKA